MLSGREQAKIMYVIVCVIYLFPHSSIVHVLLSIGLGSNDQVGMCMHVADIRPALETGRL